MHVDSVTVVFFAGLVVAVILHEISHGVAAFALGDDTARRAGRLTLNPVPHVDPFGSVVLPVLGALAHVPVIAWAKPVPVDPSRLHNRRRDMLLVSLAGPCTNLALALVAATVARVLFRVPSSGFVDVPSGLALRVQIPYLFAEANLFLGIFNFLPIPPLDGAALVERALPASWLKGWYRFRPYGILVLFLLALETNVLGRLFDPFLHHLMSFVFR